MCLWHFGKNCQWPSRKAVPFSSLREPSWRASHVMVSIAPHSHSTQFHQTFYFLPIWVKKIFMYISLLRWLSILKTVYRYLYFLFPKLLVHVLCSLLLGCLHSSYLFLYIFYERKWTIWHVANIFLSVTFEFISFLTSCRCFKFLWIQIYLSFIASDF